MRDLAGDSIDFARGVSKDEVVNEKTDEEFIEDALDDYIKIVKERLVG